MILNPTVIIRLYHGIASFQTKEYNFASLFVAGRIYPYPTVVSFVSLLSYLSKWIWKYLRSSPSSTAFWHLRDILFEARTITQCECFTWSSYQRGTLGAISRVLHMSMLASINSVELRTSPKQCTTKLHLSQHLVCMIKTRVLSEK